MAVKQGADCARETGHEVGEEGDDAVALAQEAWAEEMVKRGAADRRTALRCAAAVWALQAAKDEACAKSVVAWAGPVPMAPDVDWVDRLFEALSRAREAKNSKLALGCLFFAMNRRPYGIDSLRALAAEQRVSPEAVSNEVETMQEIMGTERTIAVKSERANESYRGTNGAKKRET